MADVLLHSEDGDGFRAEAHSQALWFPGRRKGRALGAGCMATNTSFGVNSLPTMSLSWRFTESVWCLWKEGGLPQVVWAEQKQVLRDILTQSTRRIELSTTLSFHNFGGAAKGFVHIRLTLYQLNSIPSIQMFLKPSPLGVSNWGANFYCIWVFIVPLLSLALVSVLFLFSIAYLETRFTIDQPLVSVLSWTIFSSLVGLRMIQLLGCSMHSCLG